MQLVEPGVVVLLLRGLLAPDLGIQRSALIAELREVGPGVGSSSDMLILSFLLDAACGSGRGATREAAAHAWPPA